MARVKHNVIIQGTSGSVGKQVVLKNYGNVTIISNFPDMSRVKLTSKQKEENQKFREASAYAHSQMLDPIAKAAYKAKTSGLQRAYNIAMADYYHPPEIKEINTSMFRGEPDDLIIIQAMDDFKVVRVSVEIYNDEGTILDTGDAVQTGEWIWNYHSVESFDSIKGLEIVAYAWDKPGNRAQKNIIIT